MNNFKLNFNEIEFKLFKKRINLLKSCLNCSENILNSIKFAIYKERDVVGYKLSITNLDIFCSYLGDVIDGFVECEVEFLLDKDLFKFSDLDHFSISCIDDKFFLFGKELFIDNFYDVCEYPILEYKDNVLEFNIDHKLLYNSLSLCKFYSSKLGFSKNYNTESILFHVVDSKVKIIGTDDKCLCIIDLHNIINNDIKINRKFLISNLYLNSLLRFINIKSGNVLVRIFENCIDFLVGCNIFSCVIYDNINFPLYEKTCYSYNNELLINRDDLKDIVLCACNKDISIDKFIKFNNIGRNLVLSYFDNKFNYKKDISLELLNDVYSYKNNLAIINIDKFYNSKDSNIFKFLPKKLKISFEDKYKPFCIIFKMFNMFYNESYCLDVCIFLMVED